MALHCAACAAQQCLHSPAQPPAAGPCCPLRSLALCGSHCILRLCLCRTAWSVALPCPCLLYLVCMAVHSSCVAQHVYSLRSIPVATLPPAQHTCGNPPTCSDHAPRAALNTPNLPAPGCLCSSSGACSSACSMALLSASTSRCRRAGLP